VFFNRLIKHGADQELDCLAAGLASILSHRISTHLDTMGVVNETIKDAVG
jgi:hypothetical protein